MKIHPVILELLHEYRGTSKLITHYKEWNLHGNQGNNKCNDDIQGHYCISVIQGYCDKYDDFTVHVQKIICIGIIFIILPHYFEHFSCQYTDCGKFSSIRSD